jgi:ribonuclease Z
MKQSFHAKPFNGPFEDPGLYVRILREGRALMFDLGLTGSLSARDFLKTTDIFVSHTHIDHFISFDSLLRICLRKEAPVRIYGPEGFTDRVEGKLKSYTWNLIEEYPLVIEVSEVTGTDLNKSVFKAGNSFRREHTGTCTFDGVLLKDSFFTVSSSVLDHKIPCLAFSLQEDYHINIDKAKLDKMHIAVGPWLKELKTAIRENNTEESFSIEGKTYHYSDLRDIAHITRGQKLSYVVDVIGSEENINKIINLVRGSDVLYIETYFLDKDKDRARDRYHLTAKEAGRIATEAGVERLEAIHISPRYMNDPKKIIQEVHEEFRG